MQLFKALLLNAHTVLTHGRVWSIYSCSVFCSVFYYTEDSSFGIFFRGRTNGPISSADLRSVLASRGSNKTDGQVDLDWNVDRVDESGPGTRGQESDPSDEKHISPLWMSLSCLRNCHQFKSPEYQCYTSPKSALPVSMSAHNLPATSLYKCRVWKDHSFKNLWLYFTQGSPSNGAL